ncbi:hypothetical protein E4U58_002548 [Claviceps cyperi]|nr:hypothetical protein E4U58_002548 [Claviceps cyperi]
MARLTFRDQVAISRAHQALARDELQPYSSQTTQTQSLLDIVRGWQELDALHRGHEEELLAGGSPSPTPGPREYWAQQRDLRRPPRRSTHRSICGLKLPEQFQREKVLDRTTIPRRLTFTYSLGSHQPTLPPVYTPDADMLYVEGITTLDDMAITAADKEFIEN